MNTRTQLETDQPAEVITSLAATSNRSKRVREAVCGLIGYLVSMFVVVAWGPNIFRFVMRMPYAMELAFVTLIGVAVYAVGKTVHAFFVYDWSSDSRTRPRPPRELAKTSQIQN